MIKIVDENKDFMVVDKPIGLGMHDEVGVPGLISTLKKQCDEESVYPVHRLDKVTSGLVIVAKNKQSNRQLSMAFQEKKIDKFYLAVIRMPAKNNSKVRKKQGSVIGDMEPARNGSWKLSRSLKNPAVTQFLSFGIVDRYRLCIVRPLTGKTHQIRVALKSVGLPIVGDLRYGGQVADRAYLHACSLRFIFDETEYSYTSFPNTGEFFSQPELKKTYEDLPALNRLVWPKVNITSRQTEKTTQAEKQTAPKCS